MSFKFEQTHENHNHRPSTIVASSQNHTLGDLHPTINLSDHHHYHQTVKLPVKKSPIEEASLFSKLHFTFGIPLVRLVNSLKGRELKVEDLDDIGEDESCERLEGLFTAKYYHYKGLGYDLNKVINLLLATIFKKDIYFQIFWQLIYAASKICSSYFLSQMLKYVQSPEKTVEETYYQSLGFFVAFIVAVYSMHQYNFNMNYVFNKIKTGFMGMIFRKSTRLSHHALHIMSLGKMINLTANDLNNFDKIHFLISLLIAPIVLLGGWGLLFYFWGINSFVGVGYMALLWPIEFRIARSTFEVRAKKSKETDERVEATIEGIQGIETIKYYNWDLNLIKKIKSIRELEIAKIKNFNYRECVGRALSFTSHWIASFLIYVVCTVRGGELKAYLIFPTIYLMSALRQICVFQAFLGFIFREELKLAARKINAIMALSEIEDRSAALEPVDPENSVEFKNFTAFRINSNLETDVPDGKVNSTQISMEKGSEIYQPVISNISLNIKRGNLVAIIGNSGSGKSSILLSFTTEFAKTSGEFRFQGEYAYVAQETVFFSGPLRDCITFGRPYDEEFFWKVLEACCLKDEVKALPNKEMTQIVEKGTNLSEGQRARVSLARAVYSNADVYLLDECLSNLSMKVAKSVFKNCIQGLLKDKTVILATNLLNLVKYANQIVVMERGKIVTQGTYEKLTEDDGNVEFVAALKKLPKFEPKVAEKRGYHRFASGYCTENILAHLSRHHGEVKQSSVGALINPDPDQGLYYQDERLDESKVTWRIHWKYFSTIFNWFTIVPLVLLFVGTESISWLFTIFMAKWRLGDWSNHTSYLVIGTITAVSLPLCLVKYLFYFNRTLNASNKLHNIMLTRLFQSPMKFFDRNPSGRIISRFTNDVGILDKFLIAALLDVLEGFVSFWVTLAALWTRNAWVFVSFAILVVAYAIITAWFYKTVNQTRALELTTRSPMYSLFLIGVRGLAVVRARGQSEDVIKTFYKKADEYSRANFAYITSVRLMSFLMDYVIELVVIGTFAVLLSSKDTPLSSGFFINKLGNLPSTMQWILRDFMKFHLLLASAARAVNYCQNSKSQRKSMEGVKDIGGGGRQGRSGGKVEIHNAQMRYSEKGRWVVNNLTLNIQPGEKIAIFGNSKAGVSTLIGMLTRLYELEKLPYINSYIKINGVDIKDVRISSLREAITVIPQTSVLFKDTIRNNLDPWKQHSDWEIWDAISFVGLREVIEGLDRKLETKLSKSSHIFSLGQQQLLCIARGLLKKCLIFVQDEATSHLDFATEQDIQKRLLKKYEGTTVINISHRLLTISNYDKVLTVENGETIEFGEPYLLLVNKVGDRKITKKKGCFALGVINMGQKAANEIFRNAMVTYYERHNLVLPQEEDPIISNNYFDDDEGNSDDSNSEVRENEKLKELKELKELKMQQYQQERMSHKSKSSPGGKEKDGRRRSKLERKSIYEIGKENLKEIVIPNFQNMGKVVSE